MPQIKEYIAPEFRITPSSAGYTAMENAGRRIGPLYDEAAKEINARGTIADQEARQVDALKSMYDEEGRQQAELGKLQGDLIKEKMWPYDIFKLYNEDAQAAEAKQKSLGPNKGITVFREGFTASGINKAQGTGGSLDQPDTTYISGTDDAIGGPGSPRWDSTGSGSASRGAALMGYALSDGGNAISTGYGATDNNTSTTNQTGGPAGFDINGNPLYSNAAPQAAYNSAGQPIYSYAPGDTLSQAGMAIYNAQDSALGGQNTLGYANALAAYNNSTYNDPNNPTAGLMYNTGVQSSNLIGETQPAAPGFFDNWFGTGAGSPTAPQGPQGAQD